MALDELLLHKAETGGIGETLRLWTPDEYFIAAGRASTISQDCFMERCRRERIKIIRRISGGGTVLQGPGCLNYSLVLAYESDGKYRLIRTSYLAILERVAGLLRDRGLAAEFFPVSDLAIDGKKISGNAQARKRSYLLHHGTFMVDFDIDRISGLLRHPASEPEYRKGRPHRDFVRNIPVDMEEMKRVIMKAFSAAEGEWEPASGDTEELKSLISRKYADKGWNYMF